MEVWDATPHEFTNMAEISEVLDVDSDSTEKKALQPLSAPKTVLGTSLCTDSMLMVVKALNSQNLETGPYWPCLKLIML